MPFPPSAPVGQQPLSIPGSSTSHQAFGFNPSGNSFPRQGNFAIQEQPQAHIGGRWDPTGQASGASGSGMAHASQRTSGLSNLMRSRGSEMDMNSSPPGGGSLSSNPHAGFHPSSYGPNIAFTAFALGSSAQGAGGGSYLGSSTLGMSISPPHWGSLGSGSFVGSLGNPALSTSLNREREGRERELEARYVKDFDCCGKKLNGLHELLEHYEEEHAGLAPDVRVAAINAAQGGSTSSPRAVSNPFSSAPSVPPSHPPPLVAHQSHSDAPQPPGMMDIEMEEPAPYQQPQALNLAQLQAQQNQFGVRSPGLGGQNTNPWAAAFRPQLLSSQPQCVPPSLLSYAPPSTPGLTPGASAMPVPSAAPSPVPMTPEQQAARAERKANKKRAERAAARGDEGSASETEGTAAAGEKRFPCPIEGCGKVYKQANGLKYHLTRSINSSHGTIPPQNLAALLGEKGGEVEV
ncbi:hypothetical protein B9479_002136 [Cryptococcus floricola]|uniref:C2H2-type domain-containing protein n=1 Tax=Cryptococcus floricola TaxID=2591691 RepID=A0A5D3B3W2_9TREE|nr:hypothetical protein B9479_002136 [Cryptococcus floricola]